MMENILSTAWSFVKANYGAIIEMMAISIATAASSLLLSSLCKKMIPKLKKSHLVWDDALVSALSRPLKGIIWLNGLILILRGAIDRFSTHPDFFSFLSPVQLIGSTLLLAWAFSRFVRKVEKNYLKEARLDRTTVHALSQVVRLVGMTIAGLIVVQALGLPLSGVMAFGGVGGIAVGFAAKDLLANFFGGLMIFLERPFAIGDWVRSPDRNIEGIIEHIGWRLTRIRTFDRRPLYVPNAVFSTVSVENASRMENRQILQTMGVRYEDASKLTAILREIEAMLLNHPDLDSTKTTFANLTQLGPYALEFLISAFTKTTDKIPFQRVQQDVLLKALAIIEKHGASCAFPTTTLDLPKSGMPLSELPSLLQSKLPKS